MQLAPAPAAPRRWLRGLALCALTLLAAAVRWARLREAAEPLGTDGYYYVVQVEHLLREGRPHVPDASWVLRFLAACAAAVGSPVEGVKLARRCSPRRWCPPRSSPAARCNGWRLAATGRRAATVRRGPSRSGRPRHRR